MKWTRDEFGWVAGAGMFDISINESNGYEVTIHRKSQTTVFKSRYLDVSREKVRIIIRKQLMQALEELNDLYYDEEGETK